VAARTHLFVAVLSETWGEVLTALPIAAALHARGDRVLFVAPAAMRPLFERAPYRHGWIDPSLPVLERALPELARGERCDSVVLVDLVLVYMHLRMLGRDHGFCDRFTARVVGLDMWDLATAGLVWDLGPHAWPHSPHVADVSRRIIPAPLARPDTSPAGAFDALPRPSLPPRDRARAALGLSDSERLVVLPTAAWQEPTAQRHDACARLAASFPSYLAAVLPKLSSPCRVLHVGPRAFPELAGALADRYRWLPPCSPSTFAELIAAADLMLGFNASATSIAMAVAADLPVVLGTCSHAGELDEVLAALAVPPSSELRAWLARAAPLYPFRIWPLGFARFLAPVVAGNPYFEAVESVEILDEAAVIAACEAAIADRDTRARLAAARQRYTRAVRTLPSATDVLDRLLA
jgi:hypothetical protein